MIVEGTERILADCAVETVVERVLPEDVRAMNLERFAATELESFERVREAAQAMPFLAQRRLVIVSDAQLLKADARRELWDVAQNVPDGNTLLIADLVSPRQQRPQPLGAIAGRAALRIDTTAGPDVRTRFIEETLQQLGARAEPRAIDAMADSDAELAAVRNDLEKLALGGKRITLAALERESLVIEDPKAYHFAGALVEGRTGDALGIARESFAVNRNAAIPLISALATECELLWEIARPGGTVPARLRWRERYLAPIARRVGATRARQAYERAIGAFDAIVTGRIEDPELAVDLLTAEVAGVLEQRREGAGVR